MLTPMQREILANIVAKGYDPDRIAKEFIFSKNTLKCHLAHIYSRLQVKNLTDATVKALSLGLVQLKKEER